jgi:hypothetical protein
MYPHIGYFTNLDGHPPLKPKISYFLFTSSTTTYHVSMDRQFKEDRKIVPWLKISSISPKEKYF